MANSTRSIRYVYNFLLSSTNYSAAEIPEDHVTKGLKTRRISSRLVIKTTQGFLYKVKGLKTDPSTHLCQKLIITRHFALTLPDIVFVIIIF